jgi:hypothetical protein
MLTGQSWLSMRGKSSNVLSSAAAAAAVLLVTVAVGPKAAGGMIKVGRFALSFCGRSSKLSSRNARAGRGGDAARLSSTRVVVAGLGLDAVDCAA